MIAIVASILRRPTRGLSPVVSWIRTGSLHLCAVLVCWLVGSSVAARPLALDRVEHVTVEDGLSHSTVWDIEQDDRGFLWFATSALLQRYDGYSFRDFRHDPDDPETLSASEVMELYEDRHGVLWLATRSRGLNRYDSAEDRFIRYRHDPADPSSLGDDRPRTLYEDRAGTLWVGTMSGLERFDRANEAFSSFPERAGGGIEPGLEGVLAIHEDQEGVLWIGGGSGLRRLDSAGATAEVFEQVADEPPTELFVTAIHEDLQGNLWLGDDTGLLRLDRGRRELVRHPSIQVARPVRDVTDLHQDPQGNLWITTHGSGLHCLLAENGKLPVGGGEIVSYRQQINDPHGLSSDYIFSIQQDATGILWLATRASVNKINPRREAFEVFRPGEPDGLIGSRVWAVTEDTEGTLWVGAHDGGVTAIDRKNGSVRHYQPSADDPNSLPSDAVTALLFDRTGSLWVGTRDAGLGRLERGAGEERFVEFRHDPDDPASLSSDHVYTLLEDRSGDLWVGSLATGVSRLDRETGRFRHYRPEPENPRSLTSDDVYALYEDRSGTMWVGTYGGLNRFEPQAEDFTRYVHDPQDSNSLSDNNLTTIFEDSRGMLWLGTSGSGLNRFDREGGMFRRYRVQQGLPSDSIVGILEDAENYLWLGTGSGLSRFDPVTETFRNFDTDDGLHGKIFYIGPTHRSVRGEMFFGGAGGLTAFFPAAITADPVPPRVAITELRLFNEAADLGRRDPSSPLDFAIDETRELVLGHRHKVVAFEFASLHYASPRKNLFAYRLTGFDDEWVETDAKHRIAQYTNLDAGHYTLEVKVASKDGVWSEETRTVDLRVRPPPWKSWWAYTLYSLGLLAGALGYTRYQRRELEKERLAAEQEREIAARERTANRRLREADRLKDDFLANTSHELRTPLYGITGLAESILDDTAGELASETRANLSMIVASGQRLSGLVNDILDFSKLRHKSLRLDLKTIDLRALTEVVLTLSKPLIGSKSLRLVNAIPEDLPAVHGDENRLQQILHNLIGNAVKFTEEGVVEVSARIDGDEESEGDATGEGVVADAEAVGGEPANLVVVAVRDTGLGIPPAQQAKIFDAFAQADASIERSYGGTGLGLAVTRQLVELHGGKIAVQSASGAGSVFSFTLPSSGDEPTLSVQLPSGALTTAGVDAANASVDNVDDIDVGDEHRLTAETMDGVRPATATAPAVLVVDDEPVNRRVLLNQLAAAGYRVEEAAGGAEALNQVEKRRPDLILLDVMMPRMSGYEVCRSLRERHSLEELPVIFLTAKSQPSDLVVGLAAGANDYLPKPISKSELLARVETHLALLSIHGELSQMVEERTVQVAEREQLLVERERLIGTLEERNAELARFNYTISHDLKNPLITIKNYLGLARRDVEAGQTERLDDDFSRLETAADTLQTLLDDLFELSRVGVQANPPQCVALGELAREAEERVRETLLARGVEVVIGEDLPEVFGDRERLVEILRQLLDNAAQHLGDRAEPRVEIGSRLDGATTVITVQDNGLGIDRRYHEKIFGLFERLGSEAAGTGVGLALVKRIVEVHGGRVWVESAGLGHGSTFCFTLPRQGA